MKDEKFPMGVDTKGNFVYAHKFYECPPKCDGCMYCLGGLLFCTVCKQTEAELTPSCPGPK